MFALFLCISFERVSSNTLKKTHTKHCFNNSQFWFFVFSKKKKKLLISCHAINSSTRKIQGNSWIFSFNCSTRKLLNERTRVKAEIKEPKSSSSKRSWSRRKKRTNNFVTLEQFRCNVCVQNEQKKIQFTRWQHTECVRLCNPKGPATNTKLYHFLLHCNLFATFTKSWMKNETELNQIDVITYGKLNKIQQQQIKNFSRDKCKAKRNKRKHYKTQLVIWIDN